MTGQISAVFYDDDPLWRAEAERRLNDDVLSLVGRDPPLTLPLPPAPIPDVYLVDWILSQERTAGGHAAYKGGALAYHLREAAPDRPILLLTQEGFVAPDESALLSTLPVFDGVLYKTVVETQEVLARRTILSYGRAFMALRESKKTLPDLFALLGAPSSDADGVLLEYHPSLGPAATWDVLAAARWIKELLAYPGPLIDDLTATALLGIAPHSIAFVENILDGARYKGPLGEIERRWWRSELLRLASALAAELEDRRPITYSFRDSVLAVRNIVVDPSVCNDCGESPADTVCAVLKQHVRTEHSVAYFPDQRPTVMDVARISFRALVESDDYSEEFVDPNAKALVARLREAHA